VIAAAGTELLKYLDQVVDDVVVERARGKPLPRPTCGTTAPPCHGRPRYRAARGTVADAAGLGGGAGRDSRRLRSAVRREFEPR